MPALPLDELEQLDAELLYVFVAGPGYGEGVAVALPGRGWLLLDGCRCDLDAGGGFPLASILDRWRRQDDVVEAMVLSHPHQDHAAGFADLVETLDPARVIVAGTGSVSERRDLGRAWRTRLDTEPLSNRRVLCRAVEAALQAVETWSQRRGQRPTLMSDGSTLRLDRLDVAVVARAPDRVLLREHLEAVVLTSSRANEASLVLEVSYGDSRLVLGGDLPRTRGGTVVPTGWDHVMANHPALGHHVGQKLPHHGSEEAIHPALHGPVVSERAWWLTPYNRGHRLPRLESGQGLDQLLAAQEPIDLTALPASKSRQLHHPPPGSLCLDELRDRVDAVGTGNAFVDGATDLRPRALQPLEPVWCAAFDVQGQLRGRWRGAGAVAVTR